MLKSAEIRRQAAQRLRELFPRAKGWEETVDARVGNQTADLLVKFRLGEHEQTMVVDVASLGQPRQIRAAVTKLSDVRRILPGAYPVATSVYIGPQSARILRDNNLGYVDLSGNCYLAFEHVLIEKEGKRNVRPSTRPLRSLFAPRATRVVRVLLAEPSRPWRLEELAKAAAVSLGHSHNVVKRLEDLRWVERDEAQRIHLGKPADLLQAWCESYSYRSNEIASYFVSERVTRRLMADLARAAAAEGRRYAFTLSAGLSLVAGHTRLGVIHCYLEGDPAPIAAALGLHPAGEADGALHLLSPYDPGVFHGLVDKAGLKVVSLPQLYADLARSERRGAEQAEHLRREAMGY
ncbi:MAG TPA: type IV toxin-antitoxin system AbiEi family antitoxin [Methylomirabilota bacterium]|nr:type IV toxin-antitoxin system AbiEi family antitoxin [Methylomirabilota bacterium]